jgi:flagellar biogenesis protein FliO
MLRDLWKRVTTPEELRIPQMRLLETLPLGGKRQLMLVQGGTERFLVGGGFDAVQTMVKVDGHWNIGEQPQDQLCK